MDWRKDWRSDGWKAIADESFNSFIAHQTTKEEERIRRSDPFRSFPHEMSKLLCTSESSCSSSKSSCSSSESLCSSSKSSCSSKYSLFGAILSEYQYCACYEWRKIVLRSELWNGLPKDMVEMIARLCVERVEVKFIEAPLNSHLIWLK